VAEVAIVMIVPTRTVVPGVGVTVDWAVITVSVVGVAAVVVPVMVVDRAQDQCRRDARSDAPALAPAMMRLCTIGRAMIIRVKAAVVISVVGFRAFIECSSTLHHGSTRPLRMA